MPRRSRSATCWSSLFVASLGDVVTAVVDLGRGDAVLQLLLPAAGRHVHHRRSAQLDRARRVPRSSASSPASCRRRRGRSAQEALDRRNELTRLFDLTRDILLTTEREGALAAIARHVVAPVRARHRGDLRAGRGRRLGGSSWRRGGAAARRRRSSIARSPRPPGAVEFDARTRSYGGHREIASPPAPIALAPVRIGARAIGLLATGGRAPRAGHARRHRRHRRDRARAVAVPRGAARAPS